MFPRPIRAHSNDTTRPMPHFDFAQLANECSRFSQASRNLELSRLQQHQHTRQQVFLWNVPVLPVTMRPIA